MKEIEKQKYVEDYSKAKEKGVYFFPDILYKDAIIGLIVFIILAALAFFVGAELDARADPADSSYIPRPEWYFLFLFQLLKYFPGSLEVIGVIIIPSLAIIFLILLPFIDHSAKRHFMNRKFFTVATGLIVLAGIVLTFLAVFETPPPVQVDARNQAAALYLENCTGCHGPSIVVPEGVNPHTVIAQGKHEGMPAWNADLSADEIDTLVGFILRPEGSKLFSENCAECHDVTDLIESNPFILKNALDEGESFSAHAGLDLLIWADMIGEDGRIALLNFLIAPDGERLYTVYCSSCHGSSTSFSLNENELEDIIAKGEMHVDMPSGNEKLSAVEIQFLAEYVVDPLANPEVQKLFDESCKACHSNIVPISPDVETATQIISAGGAHRSMPIWGEVLTEDQIDSLIAYIIDASELPPLEFAQKLYNQNCAFCHGEFGEGGTNPARSDDVIGPISSAEYLKTRDDFTLRMIVAQGQPTFGMSPFGAAFGGPLSDEEVDAVVAYMRNWEKNPPVEFPQEVDARVLVMDTSEIYREICAQCHGQSGEGLSGPSFITSEFRAEKTPEEIFDNINLGHKASSMLSWGEILSSNQIQELVDFILALQVSSDEADKSIEASGISFENDILPILTESCNFCHGSLGGWSGMTYDEVVSSGDHGPAVIPGDVENSLLAQKMLGTHSVGGIMPPDGKLTDDIIQIVLDWIEAGAGNN
ncbi:MAG: c-type cytochrome [Anaerolineaceae bacterium]|nr:c-type cytochrome [Anaerolineaceae bacterium]